LSTVLTALAPAGAVPSVSIAIRYRTAASAANGKYSGRDQEACTDENKNVNCFTHRMFLLNDDSAGRAGVQVIMILPRAGLVESERPGLAG
jgi:hypothetical protein